MPNELKIPEVGESITEVQISEWLKSEGDIVKQDEGVAVIDSEKTTFELPAPMGGRLTKILHKAGATVRVGEVIAHIESDGETAKAEPAEAKTDVESKPESKRPDESKSEATTEKAAEKTSPAEKPAKEREPDREKPKEEKGERAEVKKEEPKDRDEKETAPEEAQPENRQPARKTETKVPEAKPPTSAQPASAKPSADREEEVVPMTMLRRTVARRLVEAQQTMAMLTTFNEVDMSAVQALRKEHQEAFEKRYQAKLGLMSFFVKAAIDGLKQFPQLNAEIRENDIVYHNYFDIGVAIATERGLVVPVLRNAERLSFAELEKAIGDFAQRAKDGKLKPDELEGGTFTITNGGVFGSLLSTPIINPPQSGILGMHTIQERPVAVDGQVVIRPMTYLALTYDHRIVDGREAVLFLRRVKEIVETPARMLMEI
ncbi:MAG: 2-oxoglutarate dehydrogenase complex dihydrolipoyllysine-residue succinyltransferase [Verrucomicrobia bacterium]|nr:2-oxoglutarate dehydrogenase complex dihydrolipoyllysine-residue succinyltransferase [Verrucomicrobiota bacterium]